MRANKIASIILGMLVLLGVAGAVFWSKQKTDPSQSIELFKPVEQVKLRIVSGSEKIPLLEDPRLVALMAKKGLQIEATKSGSREIATRPDLNTFDVAFPAGQAAAAKIRDSVKAQASETVLITPMVVASWRPIAQILQANGIVREDAGSWWIIDMEKLLKLMREEKRWRDLPGNTAFAVGKSILVSTTNVGTSNSAAQFLALTSYLANGREVVTDTGAARRIAGALIPLFAKQGFQEQSSAGPFEDYLSMGMGKEPLVWIYESQFFEQALRGSLKPEMLILYPQPTVFSKHVVVALNDKGLRFIQAFKDPEVLAIAAEYGYRVEGDGTLKAKLAEKKLAVPDIIDVADTPTYDILESMITTIEHR